MKVPKISVVMPCHNSIAYLNQAIESILNQTYYDFEFVIVDDASADETWESLQLYVQKDKRIKIFHNKVNLGIAATRNFGLSQTSGEYYVVMDHDDISLPQRFERELSFLERNKDYAVVGCQVEVIDENSRIVGVRKYKISNTEIFSIISLKSPLCNPATMIRKACLMEFNGYDVNFSGSEDYDMWFKLATKYKLANLDETLFQYRISQKQMKTRSVRKLLEYTQEIKKKWIFQQKFFSLKGIAFYFAEKLLFLVPNLLILYLFKFFNYRKK